MTAPSIWAAAVTTLSRLIRSSSTAEQCVAWQAPEVSAAGGAAGLRRNGDADLNALQQRAWQQGLEEGRVAGIEAGTSVVFSLAILFLVVVSVYLSVHITALEDKVELLAEEVALLRGVQPPEGPARPVTEPEG